MQHLTHKIIIKLLNSCSPLWRPCQIHSITCGVGSILRIKTEKYSMASGKNHTIKRRNHSGVFWISRQWCDGGVLKNQKIKIIVNLFLFLLMKILYICVRRGPWKNVMFIWCCLHLASDPVFECFVGTDEQWENNEVKARS